MRSIGVVLREIEAVGKSNFAQGLKDTAVKVLEAEMAEIVRVASEALTQGSLDTQGALGASPAGAGSATAGSSKAK